MKTDKSWKSLQSILLMIIILLIFSYIGYDAFSFKPKIVNDITTIKADYDNLIKNKIPEIDSTLKINTSALKNHIDVLSKLNKDIKK